MNIFEPNSLLLFILFFMPGFVAMKIYDLLIPNETRSAPAYVFDAVAYSTINFIITWPLAWLILHYSMQNFITIFFIGLVVLVLTPVLIACAYVKLLSSRFLRGHTRGLVKRPWDIVFHRNTGLWVLVHLKNGKHVAGIYSSASAVSYFPHEEQIYLEKVLGFHPDGTTYSVPDTKGVIIMGSEISMIELFDRSKNHV